MAQIGLNNGARHARVSGYAVSLTGKLSGNQDLKVMQDEAVIAAAGMTWLMAKAALPSEVIDATDEALIEYDMPQMATQRVNEGK